MGCDRMRTCVGCKYFVKDGVQIPECRLNPPHTSQFVIGFDASKRPIIHNSITYDLVMPEMGCGQWKPKIEIHQ